MNDTINETATTTSTEIAGISIPFTTIPAFDIFLLSLATSAFITIVNKHFTDQAKIKALRKEMKDMQKKLREKMKEDPDKAKEIQQEIMKKNFETMKQSFRPQVFLITGIPLLFVFMFIAGNYGQFGDILNLGLFEVGWLGSYIIFSIANSIILKKVLNVA